MNDLREAKKYFDEGLEHYNKGEYEKALQYYKKALTVFEKVLGIEDSDTLATYNNIAGVYQAKGEYEKALEYYKKAFDAKSKNEKNIADFIFAYIDIINKNNEFNLDYIVNKLLENNNLWENEIYKNNDIKKLSNELIFNPYKSDRRNITINLGNLDEYEDFNYCEGLSFANINKDDYKKVENNIGYLLKEIFNIINKLEDKDIQYVYKALGNIKYLIKNSSWENEQELRILKILKYDYCVTDDDERKYAYKHYFTVIRDSALERIILGSEITDVDSVAEKLREDIKNQSKKDKRYEGINVSVSEHKTN